jgi:hypothetical protein
MRFNFSIKGIEYSETRRKGDNEHVTEEHVKTGDIILSQEMNVDEFKQVITMLPGMMKDLFDHISKIRDQHQFSDIDDFIYNAIVKSLPVSFSGTETEKFAEQCKEAVNKLILAGVASEDPDFIGKIKFGNFAILNFNLRNHVYDNKQTIQFAQGLVNEYRSLRYPSTQNE